MSGTNHTFDDVTIQRLFGHEAAENESRSRLREYYFKSHTYERITADLPLRLLIGHKGTGKSALFTVAQQEDAEAGSIAILIRPDDVAEVANSQADVLPQINEWKIGILRIVYEKILQKFDFQKHSTLESSVVASGRFLQFIIDTIEPMLNKFTDLDRSQALFLSTFLLKREVHVYLDDLDRGWRGDRASILRMSSMLSALRDLSNEHEGLSFRVALRSDVYYLVRTADESTDKIEGAVVWQSWTNHEILAMLVKRVESFFGREHSEHELLSSPQSDLARFLDSVFVATFNGQGHWKNAPTYRVLMSLIRKRPRDLVKLCTLAAQEAHLHGRNRIYTNDLLSVFERYSQERLQDTTNEFRSELPDIERLLQGMRPNRREQEARLGYTYTTDGLIQKIKQIEQSGSFRFSHGKPANTKALAQFLYKVNFLTARKELSNGEIVRKFFEENKYLSSELSDFGFGWEVHPAYRWALQPDDVNSIFLRLQLSSDSDEVAQSENRPKPELY